MHNFNIHVEVFGLRITFCLEDREGLDLAMLMPF